MELLLELLHGLDMPSITLTVTAQMASKLADLEGKHKGYTNEDGTPRSATTEEIRQGIIEREKAFYKQIEYATQPITVVEIT